MYYFRLERLKNMPSNFSFSKASFAIIIPQDNFLSEIQEVLSRVDTDKLNPVFKRNVKFPRTLFKPNTPSYIYVEFRVIDGS